MKEKDKLKGKKRKREWFLIDTRPVAGVVVGIVSTSLLLSSSSLFLS